MNQIFAPSLLFLQLLVNILGGLNDLLYLILTIEKHLVEFTV